MIVYGKRRRRMATRELVDGARDASARDALVAAGELWCAIADHATREHGVDDISDTERAVAAVARAAGRRLAGGPDVLARALDALPPLPDLVDVAAAIEGYAFYGVYPESFAEAARSLGRATPTVVVGLRSIGTGLAAAVAGALDAVDLYAVRPIGHPFDRTLALGPRLTTALANHASAGRRFVVVDEGPGLSGSSLACAVEKLEALGARSVQLVVGHGAGPGPAASERVRATWARTPAVASVRHVPAVGARIVRDLSAGRWRELLYADRASWPPADARHERTKLLLEGGRLARFTGLGRRGRRSAERAEALSSAGFSPEVEGLADGFLLTRWISGTPLRASRVTREAFLDRLATYLSFRARELAPVGDGGASPAELLAMIEANAREAGLDPEPTCELHTSRLERIAHRTRRVAIDGRLHAWEWLVDDRGRILKSDALDHGAAHDLVGEQDLAWDVAGAIVEHALDADEVARLRARLPSVDDEVLAFHRTAYLAFQLGWATHAAQHVAEDDASRLRAQAARYRAALARAIDV